MRHASCMSYICVHYVILISARMKTLSDFNKFVDNFRYDLDENICLRADYKKRTGDLCI